MYYGTSFILLSLILLLEPFPDPVLQFLLSCLKQPQLATVAATAIQSVCTACRDKMGISHFPSILQTVEALDEFNMSNNAALGLLKGRLGKNSKYVFGINP
jgi:hypothetical protein